jgi:hypothetical protein
MSDNHDYLRTGEASSFRLSADVLMLMLRGAGYAAIFCIAMLFLMLGMYWVGTLLPEESRDTEDPTPFSYELRIEADQIA